MTAPTKDDLLSNRLLSALREVDRERLAPHMMIFEMESGDILQRTGDDVVNTWFPCNSSMAAFCIATHDGSSLIEVALVGREGAVGGIVSNGHIPAFATTRVQFGGRFLRIKTAALELAKLDSLNLRHWFSRYSDCLLAQVFQTAACNATHTITQRAAKWLLAAASRTTGSEFELTQEQLAETLGVGRTFVTRVVGRLREEGVIATRRGTFIIRNEAALRALSCPCTVVVENHFDTVLHGIYPTE